MNNLKHQLCDPWLHHLRLLLTYSFQLIGIGALDKLGSLHYRAYCAQGSYVGVIWVLRQLHEQ
jgi:hypothetical protein